MDGTLLDSRSRILPSSAAAIRAALAKGVTVVLATGKARPAAVAACAVAGLAGDGLLVSERGPGVFLQGLAVYGVGGRQLNDASLPRPVVEAAFSWAARAGVSCVAFHGDTCSTLELTPALVELHERYYEPLAAVAPSVETLLEGEAVRKLLFMADAERIAADVRPHWAARLAGPGLGGAEAMQAVPTMLEVVPRGVDKWTGLSVLLEHLGLSPDDLMAVGDGGNDAGGCEWVERCALLLSFMRKLVQGVCGSATGQRSMPCSPLTAQFTKSHHLAGSHGAQRRPGRCDGQRREGDTVGRLGRAGH
jgi:hydroxymethylpyrimidine pyrophosphatase-like HAD family hydrolase